MTINNLILFPRGGVNADTEIKPFFLRRDEILELSKDLSFNPGIGQNIACHALPTDKNSAFLISAVLVPSASFPSNPHRKYSDFSTINSESDSYM